MLLAGVIHFSFHKFSFEFYWFWWLEVWVQRSMIISRRTLTVLQAFGKWGMMCSGASKTEKCNFYFEDFDQLENQDLDFQVEKIHLFSFFGLREDWFFKIDQNWWKSTYRFRPKMTKNWNSREQAEIRKPKLWSVEKRSYISSLKSKKIHIFVKIFSKTC